jgi:hypothetical protein
MTHKSDNSGSTNIFPRCQHRTPNGRRCRFPVTPQASSFCQKHFAFHQEDSGSTDLAPALLGDLTEIVTASDMQHVLGKLFLLLAQNRIATKKAAVLTYIIQQLLRTLPAIERELGAQSPDAGPTIIMDLPRPVREPACQPS